MEAEKTRLEKQIVIMEQSLEQAPKGTLIYVKADGKYYYYEQIIENKKKTRIYLKDQGRVKVLFEKKLHQAWLRDYQEELKAVNSYLKWSNGMPRTESLLSHEAMANVMLKAYAEWQYADYERNPYHPEQLVYQGANGRKVRSKSEGDIDWGLDEGKLPNRYEPKIIMSGKKVYPDFQIIHPITKRVILWEHFGMMDDPEYEKKAYEKIRLYRENGYFPDDNLILTFEDKAHPLTNQKIHSVIQYHFGDWLEVCKEK